MKVWALAIIYVITVLPVAYANSLSVPLVFRAEDIDPIVNYPIEHLRVFKSSAKGKAIAIPFQIDELNRYGDFIFNTDRADDRGNKIFDLLDELAIMAGDLGPRVLPTMWPSGIKPFRLYQVITSRTGGNNTFYVGVFLTAQKPPLATRSYVRFDSKTSTVETQKYRLTLNRRNYLAIEDVTFKFPHKNVSLIDWSSFYLKLDFKYFLTFEEDQDSIESRMSSFKSGAIRTIIRVDFIWRLLKLKLNPGFFTEMSFFAGSLHLPALVYTPFDNKKILNKGSEMYYGFALVDNPEILHIETNMPRYATRQEHTPLLRYWLGVYARNYAVLVNLHSNDMLRRNKFAPSLFTENKPATGLRSGKKSSRNRVNVALYFDLTRFAKGEQRLSFQSFFVNRKRDLQSLSAQRFSSYIPYVIDISSIPISRLDGEQL